MAGRRVVVVTAAALALGSVLGTAPAALAQEPAPEAPPEQTAPPPPTSGSEPSPDPATEPAPPPTESEPPPAETSPDPTQEDTDPPPTPTDPPPVADDTAADPTDDASAPADGEAEGVVDLEEETPAATAPAPTEVVVPVTPAAPAAPAAPEATASVTITLEQPAAAAQPAPSAAQPAALATPPDVEVDEVAIVNFVGQQDVIARLIQDARPTARPALTRAAASVSAVGIEQRCVRPSARVPMSSGCEEARAAAAVLGVPLAELPSPEVSAAIERGTARLVARQRQVVTRASPPERAAKKPRVDNARPLSVFGNGGVGFSNDGYSGSSASTSSSRIFAVGLAPTSLPQPLRFPELRLPTADPQGLVAAPPPARPG